MEPGSATRLVHPAYARLRKAAFAERRALARALAIELDWRCHDGPEWAARYWAAFGPLVGPQPADRVAENRRAMCSERVRWPALPATESARLRTLFRSLLAVLHPELHPAARRGRSALLWTKILGAYRRGDVPMLERLGLQADMLESNSELPCSVVALRQEYARLCAVRTAADRRLAGLSQRFPFCLRDKLSDPAWVRHQQLALRQIQRLVASPAGGLAADTGCKQVS